MMPNHSAAVVRKFLKIECGYLGKLLHKPTAYDDLTGLDSAEYAAIMNATGSWHSDLHIHGGTAELMAGWQMDSGSGDEPEPHVQAPFGTGPYPPDFETTDPGSRFTHRNVVAAIRRAKRWVMSFLWREGGWFDPNKVKTSVLGCDYDNWKAKMLIETAKVYRKATSSQGDWLRFGGIGRWWCRWLGSWCRRHTHTHTKGDNR